MDILAQKYIDILRFVRLNENKLDFDELFNYFQREDVVYLMREYIKSSYNLMALQPNGANYLSWLDQEHDSRYATKKDNKKATMIAIIALVISGIGVIAQLVLGLLQGN